jgi:hypothetical protein
MKVFYQHKGHDEGSRQQKEIATMMLDKVRQRMEAVEDVGNRNTVATALYWLEMALNNGVNEACAQLWLSDPRPIKITKENNDGI